MTRRPERTWNDPPMPDGSPMTIEKASKIVGRAYTRRGVKISLAFIWTLWAMCMIQEWVIWDDVTLLLLAQTFIPLTVYAILISPITEWSWNLITGGKS